MVEKDKAHDIELLLYSIFKYFFLGAIDTMGAPF